MPLFGKKSKRRRRKANEQDTKYSKPATPTQRAKNAKTETQRQKEVYEMNIRDILKGEFYDDFTYRSDDNASFQDGGLFATWKRACGLGDPKRLQGETLKKHENELRQKLVVSCTRKVDNGGFGFIGTRGLAHSAEPSDQDNQDQTLMFTSSSQGSKPEIELDLKALRENNGGFVLTHYALRHGSLTYQTETYPHLVYWTVEGSVADDKDGWKPIDEKNHFRNFVKKGIKKDSYPEKLFTLNRDHLKHRCDKYRLRMTGKNAHYPQQTKTGKAATLFCSNIELYGYSIPNGKLWGEVGSIVKLKSLEDTVVRLLSRSHDERAKGSKQLNTFESYTQGLIQEAVANAVDTMIEKYGREPEGFVEILAHFTELKLEHTLKEILGSEKGAKASRTAILTAVKGKINGMWKLAEFDDTVATAAIKLLGFLDHSTKLEVLTSISDVPEGSSYSEQKPMWKALVKALQTLLVGVGSDGEGVLELNLTGKFVTATSSLGSKLLDGGGSDAVNDEEADIIINILARAISFPLQHKAHQAALSVLLQLQQASSRKVWLKVQRIATGSDEAKLKINTSRESVPHAASISWWGRKKKQSVGAFSAMRKSVSSKASHQSFTSRKSQQLKLNEAWNSSSEDSESELSHTDEIEHSDIGIRIPEDRPESSIASNETESPGSSVYADTQSRFVMDARAKWELPVALLAAKAALSTEYGTSLSTLKDLFKHRTTDGTDFIAEQEPEDIIRNLIRVALNTLLLECDVSSDTMKKKCVDQPAQKLAQFLKETRETNLAHCVLELLAELMANSSSAAYPVVPSVCTELDANGNWKMSNSIWGRTGKLCKSYQKDILNVTNIALLDEEFTSTDGSTSIWMAGKELVNFYERLKMNKKATMPIVKPKLDEALSGYVFKALFGDDFRGLAALYGKSQFLNSDLYNEFGTPRHTIFQPSHFQAKAGRDELKNRVQFVAAAVRHLLEGRVLDEIKCWHSQFQKQKRFMTPVDVTMSVRHHFRRFVDTPIDSLQKDALNCIIPDWYDSTLVMPAVDTYQHHLDLRLDEVEQYKELLNDRVEKLLHVDKQMYEKFQKLAEEKLELDSRESIAKLQDLKMLAKTKCAEHTHQQRQMHQGLSSNSSVPKTSRGIVNLAKRPDRSDNHETQVTMNPQASIATVKLQAVKLNGTFHKLMEELHKQGHSKIIQQGFKVDHDTGLLVSDKEEKTLKLTKSGYRMAQKACLKSGLEKGDVGQICDVNRALARVESIPAFIESINKTFDFLRNKEIEIVEVKDRINVPTDGGWSDLVVLFKVSDDRYPGESHICELQMALAYMVEARETFHNHDSYAQARANLELMQLKNIPYDGIKTQHRHNEALKGTLDGEGKMEGRIYINRSVWWSCGRKINTERWVVLQKGFITFHKTKPKKINSKHLIKHALKTLEINAETEVSSTEEHHGFIIETYEERGEGRPIKHKTVEFVVVDMNEINVADWIAKIKNLISALKRESIGYSHDNRVLEKGQSMSEHSEI